MCLAFLRRSGITQTDTLPDLNIQSGGNIFCSLALWDTSVLSSDTTSQEGDGMVIVDMLESFSKDGDNRIPGATNEVDHNTTDVQFSTRTAGKVSASSPSGYSLRTTAVNWGEKAAEFPIQPAHLGNMADLLEPTPRRPQLK